MCVSGPKTRGVLERGFRRSQRRAKTPKDVGPAVNMALREPQWENALISEKCFFLFFKKILVPECVLVKAPAHRSRFSQKQKWNADRCSLRLLQRQMGCDAKVSAGQAELLGSGPVFGFTKCRWRVWIPVIAVNTAFCCSSCSQILVVFPDTITYPILGMQPMRRRIFQQVGRKLDQHRSANLTVVCRCTHSGPITLQVVQDSSLSSGVVLALSVRLLDILKLTHLLLLRTAGFEQQEPWLCATLSTFW